MTYLDDRPVFPRDRACAEAWEKGGRDAEREERQKWDNAEHKRIMDSVKSLLERRDKYQAEQRGRSQQQDEQTSQENHENENNDELIDVKINNIQESEYENVQGTKVLIKEVHDDSASDYVIVEKSDTAESKSDEVIEVKIYNQQNKEKTESFFSSKLSETDTSSKSPLNLFLNESNHETKKSDQLPKRILIEEINYQKQVNEEASEQEGLVLDVSSINIESYDEDVKKKSSSKIFENFDKIRSDQYDSLD